MEGYDTLYEVLVKLFNEIIEIEEKAIITEEFKDITNNDMHVIEAIGVQEPRNMSSIARAMDVTVGTLTIAMNSLVKKGYVTRTRSEKDRRVVFIALTEKGKKAYDHHQRFHREMIDAVLSDLTEEETQVLARALENLLKFFREKERRQD